MSSLKDKYEKSVKEELIKLHGYTNPMDVPKLVKIVLNRGLGEATSNAKVVELSVDIFTAISGQKPIIAKAKKSISNFKLRQGQAIGCKVTLRSQKMYDFLTKLVNVSLPKIRDFRGLNTGGFDGMGNYTFGVKEDTIFPEILNDRMDKIRGLDVCIVTTARTNDEAYDLLRLMGMPFKERVKTKS